MEDAATAEISRSQIWQLMHQGAKTTEGTTITREWVEEQIQTVVRGFGRTDGDRIDCATLAHSVEQLPRKEQVASSILAGGSSYSPHISLDLCRSNKGNYQLATRVRRLRLRSKKSLVFPLTP